MVDEIVGIIVLITRFYLRITMGDSIERFCRLVVAWELPIVLSFRVWEIWMIEVSGLWL